MGGGTVDMDLVLDVMEDGGALKGDIMFRTDLFEHASIERMAEHLQVMCLCSRQCRNEINILLRVLLLLPLACGSPS